MTEYSAGFLAQYPKYYGASWQGRKPDYSRCAGDVPDGGRSVTSHQCSRANGHGPHGAWCRMHDPAARKAKADASHAKWVAESDAADRDRVFTMDCRTAIREIAAGHADPRGLAQGIVNKLEGRG